MIDAMEGFGEALDATRDRGQPDEFALANAIERALISTAAAGDGVGPEEIEQLFDDPDHHEMPSEDLTSRVTSIWDER